VSAISLGGYSLDSLVQQTASLTDKRLAVVLSRSPGTPYRKGAALSVGAELYLALRARGSGRRDALGEVAFASGHAVSFLASLSVALRQPRR
jgi:hypothetical protein